MVETVLAVLIIVSVFFTLFHLSQLLNGKIVLEHAAMRTARARAVGLNDFMCLKVARVSSIPAAGKRLKPQTNDERGAMSETALARMYIRTPDASYADGLLRYEGWDTLQSGVKSDASAHPKMKVDGVMLEGDAKVDEFPIYLEDHGL